ncbi:MAG: TolB family protein [Breznakibacter sp.]
MFRIRISLLIVLFFSCHLLFAQYYSSGSDPVGIRWQQIKTPHVRLLFSSDMQPYAQRLAAIFDTLNQVGGYSLAHRSRRIDVLLHSRTTYSNGFVSWAPKRSELFTTASQSIGSMDWLQHLAIHEYRHVVQMDKLNSGFTRWAGYLFGQQATGAVAGLYLPFWFLEGDAVLTETLLSQSGRGRMPEFEQNLRAQLVAAAPFSMSKAYLGSYRDYVPNYYQMGYALVAGARSRYGEGLWSRAVEQTGKRSWSLTPFNRAIRQTTGMGKRALYASVFADWQQQWRQQDEKLWISSFDSVTSSNTEYINYRYPQAVGDHCVVAEMVGPGIVKQFVRIHVPTGKRETLYVPGIREDEPFSVAGNLMVWTEMEPHWRWENQMFSNIYQMDLASRQVTRLTTQGRYFAPAIFADGQRLAAIHISEDHRNAIHLLNFKGELLEEHPIPGNEFPVTPVWSSRGNELVMVLLNGQGKRLVAFNTATKAWRNLTEASFNQIRLPRVVGDEVYFASSQTGIENIFKVPIEGGKPVQVTSSRFGAAGAIAWPGDSILYSDYAADGYGLVKAPRRQSIPSDSAVLVHSEQVLEKPLAGELPLVDWSGLPEKEYPMKNYSKWNLAGIHSWAPVAVNIDQEEVRSGVSVLSQNRLGTAMASAGFYADQQMSLEKYFFNFTYKGWYPVLSLNVTHGDDRVDNNYYALSGKDTVSVFSHDRMVQTRVKGSVSLPIYLSRGRYSRYLEPMVGVEHFNNSGYQVQLTPVTAANGRWVPKGETENLTVDRLNFADLQYGLFFSNIRRASSRDVGSRWGQSLQLRYRHTPWGDNNLGSMWGAMGRLYLPGLMRYHQIRLEGGFQQKEGGDVYSTSLSGRQYRYLYSDFVSFPRGYGKQMNDQLASIKLNYHFPLLNPDWSVGSVLYLKRIRMNLFYDYARREVIRSFTNQPDNRTVFNNRSLGTELMTETHFFQFLIPMELGYRLAYLPGEKRAVHEFLLSVNFYKYVGR